MQLRSNLFVINSRTFLFVSRNKWNLRSLSITAAKAKCPSQEEQNNVRDNELTDNIKWEDAKPMSVMPGPKPWPLIGIAYLFMPGGKYYNQHFGDVNTLLRRDYGDIIYFPGMLGRKNLVMSYNPDDIAKAYRNEGKWPMRPGFESFEYFKRHMRPDIFKGYAGLLADNGEPWYEVRTKANPIMLKPQSVQRYIKPVDEIACEFIERIKTIRDDKMEVPANFSNELSKWSFESIAAIGLETRLGVVKNNEPDPDSQKLIQSINDFFDLSMELDVLPSIWKYYKTRKFAKMMVTLDTMTTLITKYVDQAIQNIQKKESILIESDSEPSVLEKLYKIDRHIAIIVALDMLMAGVDTTSGSTANLLYYLAKNPIKQNKLRQEIIEKLPSKTSEITVDLLKHIPYLRACIKESSRIKPITLGTIRVMSEDVVLGGYQIPKGTDVVLQHTSLQNDEKHFPRSSEFIPERWLTNAADFDITPARDTHPFVYLPFGFGVRTCIGRRFAELEMQIIILRIIRNFQVEFHYPPLKFGKGILNIPKGDLKFKFVDVKH